MGRLKLRAKSNNRQQGFFGRKAADRCWPDIVALTCKSTHYYYQREDYADRLFTGGSNLEPSFDKFMWYIHEIFLGK